MGTIRDKQGALQRPVHFLALERAREQRRANNVRNLARFGAWILERMEEEDWGALETDALREETDRRMLTEPELAPGDPIRRVAWNTVTEEEV